MYTYAQIDGNGYIVAISNLSGEVIADNMIPVPSGFNDLYQRWNGEEWIPIEKPEPEPTDSDKLEALSVNMEYLVAMSEMEMEV